MAFRPARMLFNGVVIGLGVGLMIGCQQEPAATTQATGGDAARTGAVRAPLPLVGPPPIAQSPPPPPKKTTTGNVAAGGFGKGNV